MTQEKSKRVFLAIDLPGDVKEQIMAIQNKLKFLLEGVRWVRPEAIHLTLKFFGDIRSDDTARISEMIAEKTRDAAPITLNTDNIGAFPNLERPRVLWLGMTGDVQRLMILQQVIEAGLEPHGFKREKRKFRPHLTLGRAKSSRGMILGLSEAVITENHYTTGDFTAQGLTLFQSELRPGGAVYTNLAYFQFGE
ncbi:MAG TPA: RNA 2',3'-cyclic phosphodiesterase [Deltaproteobacteria bacterium]|nr:RNA 2',3'-cyclic phosphodiesterase [Deltaproteobacteria bacterium]